MPDRGLARGPERAVACLRPVRAGPRQDPARLSELGFPRDVESQDVDRVVVRGHPADELLPLAVGCGGQLLVGDRIRVVALLVAVADRLLGGARTVRVQVEIQGDRAGACVARAACGQRRGYQRRARQAGQVALPPAASPVTTTQTPSPAGPSVP